MRRAILWAAGWGLAAVMASAQSVTELQEQVRAAERAFARTMADRDHAAFASFLAEDAIFLSGPKQALRGRQAVAAGWKRLYEEAQAPFSWEPETVEVQEGGAFALSTGPVRDPQGRRTGTFNSIWRRERDGKWRVIFDNGCPPCPCEPPASTKPPAP